MWVIDSFAFYFAFIGLCCIGLFLFSNIILGKSVETKGDFFEHQNLAHKKLKWLYLIFLLTLGLIFLTSYGILFFSIESAFKRDKESIAEGAKMLSIILVIVIIIAYFYKVSKMSKNTINAIARELGAEEIIGTNLLEKEKILLNIISEMSIASSVKMPRVFIMNKEFGINAMCVKCGERFAIFGTRVAIDSFDRDEMQGVIGHEFSHIFHGDVELNMKLAAIVFAMSFIGVGGIRMLRDTEGYLFINRMPQLVFAMALIVIGFVGSTFGRIIQSAISMQKEFLADASSVQYTRNPDGIRGALRKLWQGKNAPNLTRIANANASPYAHMFFLPSIATLFATHPSIKERLKRLRNI